MGVSQMLINTLGKDLGVRVSIMWNARLEVTTVGSHYLWDLANVCSVPHETFVRGFSSGLSQDLIVP